MYNDESEACKVRAADHLTAGEPIHGGDSEASLRAVSTLHLDQSVSQCLHRSGAIQR